MREVVLIQYVRLFTNWFHESFVYKSGKRANNLMSLLMAFIANVIVGIGVKFFRNEFLMADLVGEKFVKI